MELLTIIKFPTDSLNTDKVEQLLEYLTETYEIYDMI